MLPNVSTLRAYFLTDEDNYLVTFLKLPILLHIPFKDTGRLSSVLIDF